MAVSIDRMFWKPRRINRRADGDFRLWWAGRLDSGISWPEFKCSTGLSDSDCLPGHHVFQFRFAIFIKLDFHQNFLLAAVP